MNQKTLIIFILVILAVAAGVYYFGFQRGYKLGVEIGRTAAETSAGTAVTNPLEKMPETNPFGEVVNPFKDLYKNPFK